MKGIAMLVAAVVRFSLLLESNQSVNPPRTTCYMRVRSLVEKQT